ncbi:MAG TPA: serine dehydratase beta chain, partial [Accumulibacter sp.]|uniref:serine dehydratase beta chain n=1 Tax=Accumulibacter sp. TaxID=2053492 RepID=UPI002BA8722C
MKSLQELFRIGLGPSSSHTMGPRFAATAFRAANPTAARVRVTLYGTLAATGRGHLTDLAVSAPFSPRPVDIVWLPQQSLPRHPNGMQFEALDAGGRVLAARVVYSVGGGALLDEDGQPDGGGEVYPHAGMDAVLDETEREGLRIWEIVDRHEG